MTDYHLQREKLKELIGSALCETAYEKLVLDIFGFQYQYNAVYRQFCQKLGRNADSVKSLEDIPFLPVTAFKHYSVKTGEWDTEKIFWSSATSGQQQSSHCMLSLEHYLAQTRLCFEANYGSVEQYSIYALLPAYLEREGSSLVTMAEHFIKLSKDSSSGFFLYDHQALASVLEQAVSDNRRVLLLGVSFALLDFAEKYKIDLKHTIIMETGGMKGRRKELPRQQIHAFLQKRLGVQSIHSEYGMTEMSSQVYSQGDGIFHEHTQVNVVIHQLTDPLTIEQEGRTGNVSIIDLGNLDTCAFLRTDDLGRKYGNTFTIEGRTDHSEIRGCNLMVSDLG